MSPQTIYTDAGARSCGVSIYRAYARAWVGITGDGISLGGDGYYALPTFFIDGRVFGDWSANRTFMATAESRFDMQFLMETTGPTRLGYLQMYFFAIVTSYNSGGGSTFSVGPHVLNSRPRGSNCSQCTQPLIPFQLGSQFLVSLTGRALGLGTWYSGDSVVVSGTSSFRFFEADGVTPVAVSTAETPEPATWLGVSIGIGLIAFRGRSRRNRKQIAGH